MFFDADSEAAREVKGTVRTKYLLDGERGLSATRRPPCERSIVWIETGEPVREAKEPVRVRANTCGEYLRRIRHLLDGDSEAVLRDPSRLSMPTARRFTPGERDSFE